MILSILKEETRDLHQQTEALFYGNEIFSGQLSSQQYHQMILKNLYIYEQLESAIAKQFPLYFPDTEYQPCFSKHKLLEKDAQVLNLSREKYKVSPPTFTSPESLLGGIYVIEGSMLGGKIIGRKLREIFSNSTISNFYFYNHEIDNVDRWRHFCHFITRHVNTHISIRNATIGANAAFKFFHEVYKVNRRHTFSL
jgi:heme oxygenase